MVSWVLSRFQKDGPIIKTDGKLMASMAPKSYANIYRLPPPKENADEAYMRAFMVKNLDYDDFLREWWYDSDSFQLKPLEVCPTQYFHVNCKLTAIMFCRLFGEKN